MCRPGNSASLRYMEELFIPDLPRPPTRHPDGGGAPRRGVAAAVPGYALHRCRNASTLILIDALLSSCLTRGRYDLDLNDLADQTRPILQGWMQYYGRFTRSAL